MKTITLAEPGRFQLHQSDAPQSPQAREAVVRVRRVGICGTDLHAYRGRQPFFTYPRILGHELGVEILEIGPNDCGYKPGDYCAVEPYFYCGRCIACRKGKTNCCLQLQVLGVQTDGGMRELLSLPVGKLHSSRTLSLEQLALVETLGIGAHAVQRAHVEPGEPVLVLGAGPIGLSVIQFAQIAGAQVIVADTNQQRLAFCEQQMGVRMLIDAKGDMVSQLQGLLSGELPSVVFDATGNPTSMMSAFHYVAHGGKLVFVGLFLGEVTFNDPNFHRRELTLLASRNATTRDFDWIIGLLESGRINTQPWITHMVSSEEMIAAFPDWLKPESGVIKAMVEF